MLGWVIGWIGWLVGWLVGKVVLTTNQARIQDFGQGGNNFERKKMFGLFSPQSLNKFNSS